MITWVIEPDIFSDNDSRLVEAAIQQGHEVMYWKDKWTVDGKFPIPKNRFVIFHCSLGIAVQITCLTPWNPGAFCSTDMFYCSAWYEECMEWLLNKCWVYTSVAKFVHNPEPILQSIPVTDSVFVRPDSPLKPFSGRVIRRSDISLKALDYGFYYSDENLPIVVAPVKDVTKEWRFIVIDRQVVAGSEYVAADRNESGSLASGREWDFAQTIASRITPPDDAYVLDVCEADGGLALLEINPFSGADLYACDRKVVATAMDLLADR